MEFARIYIFRNSAFPSCVSAEGKEAGKGSDTARKGKAVFFKLLQATGGGETVSAPNGLSFSVLIGRYEAIWHARNVIAKSMQ